MPSSKLLLGGAAAGAALSVRVARSLYGHWRRLPPDDRLRLADVAADAKEKALALRGLAPAQRAAGEAGLRGANESLAEALMERAEADPELGPGDLDALREDLRRELERLPGAEIHASRGPSGARPGEVEPSQTRRKPTSPAE